MSAANDEFMSARTLASIVADVLDQAGIGVAAMDADGHLLLLNDALTEMTGQPYTRASHAELPDIFPLFTETGLRPLAAEEIPLVRAWYGEQVSNAHILVKRPGHAPKHLRCNAVPLPSGDGRRRGAMVVVEDVTDAREGGTAFTELRDVLITSLNHEFRTPLSAILGHTELLEDISADVPPAARRSVEAIQRAGQRLAAVADDVSALVDRRAGKGGGVNVRTIELPNSDPDGPTYRSTRFTVYPAGWDRIADDQRRDCRVTVEDAGDGWAVRWRNRCLNYRYDWEFEPRAGSRTDDFLNRCRFSQRAALNRAKRAVDELVIDGMTFEEFVTHVQSKAAAKARAALAEGVSGSPDEFKPSRPVLPLQRRLRKKRAQHPPHDSV